MRPGPGRANLGRVYMYPANREGVLLSGRVRTHPTMDAPKIRQTLSDDVLIGKPWSRARLWNREPLDDFYAEALEKYGTDDAISEEQEKKLRRKIDYTILPVCVFMSSWFSIR